MSAEGITIKLSNGEHHTLLQLLDRFIHVRVWEAVRSARNEVELDKAADQTKRLAQLRELANEDVLRGDLDAHLTDLTLWLMETEDSSENLERALAEVEENARDELSAAERAEAIETRRASLVMDYAHRCVCERIIGAIKASREVTA